MKKAYNKLLLFIRKIRVKRRMMATFCVVSIIPLVTLGIMSYRISSNAIVEKISQSTLQSLVMAEMNVQNVVERLESNSIEFAFSPIAQDALENYSQLSEFNKFKITQQMQQNIAKQFILTNFVSDVVLVTNNFETLVAYGGRSINVPLEKEYLKTIAQKTRKAEGKSVFTVIGRDPKNPGNKGILLSRVVNNIISGDRMGYIIICFDEAYLRNICEISAVGTDTFTLIVDNNNTVITSNSQNYLPGSSFQDPNLTTNLFTKSLEKNSFNYVINNKDYLLTFREILSNRWYIVNCIPYSYLNRENSFFAVLVSLIIAGSVLVSLFIANIISKSIDQPLKTTLGLISRVNQGKLVPGEQDAGSDEIAQVNASFNDMIIRLKVLLENVSEMEKQRMDLEFKALMAQINPHFLSNTLSSVKWMAEMQSADNIVQLTSALIEILEGTMGGEEWTTVRKEIRFLQDYITIQQYRYLDKFIVDFSIEPDVQNCIIPKFILQPIVENAIIHGIASQKGQGIISVACKGRQEFLYITIKDNGAGIPSQKLARLLETSSQERSQRFTSIGLNNTNDRIKLRFGAIYGLEITSEEGFGTTVQVLLPLQQKQEENNV